MSARRFFEYPAHGSRWTWYPREREPLPANWNQPQEANPWIVLAGTFLICGLPLLAAFLGSQ